MKLTVIFFKEYIFELPFFPIFDVKDKFIFFQQPKTGFKSVMKAIGEDRYCWHRTKKISNLFAYEKINSYTDIDIQNCFTFSIVRNPWDRIVSGFFHYRYNVKDEWAVNLDFKYFVKNILIRYYDDPLEMYRRYEKLPGLKWGSKGRWLHFAPMYARICKDGEIFVDYIGKLENIDEDWKYISRQIDVEYSRLPVIGSSKRTHYRDYYDIETKNIIYKMFREDIEIFDYKY